MNDGGPAFPQSHDSWYRQGDAMPAPSGMSLRDWFAGMATDKDIDEVIKAYNEIAEALLDQIGDTKPHEPLSRQAARYIHADKMLAERNRNAPTP